MDQAGVQKGMEIEQVIAPKELLVQANGPHVPVQTSVLPSAKLLWTNRKFLRTALLVGLLAGVVISLLTPSLYVSSVQLMPPDSHSATGTAMLAALLSKTNGGIGSVAGDLLGGQTSGALFLGILRSRTLEDRIIERFQLKKVYRVKLEEDARNELAERTGLAEDHKSGIISIAVTDHDRTRAKAMAGAYVEELNRLVAELSTSSARREREFLEARLSAVKIDLDQASRDFSVFSSKSGAIDIKEQGRAMVEAGAALQGEVIADEAQLHGLEAIYTPNNVRVRSLQARIDELNKQLQQVGGTGAEVTNDDTSTATSLYPPLRKLPLLGVKYADLYRKTKIQEAVYETLTQQYELAKVQEAKEIPSVRLLDDADLPQRRSFPPRMLITFMSGLTALFLASLWILTKNRWDQTATNNEGKQFAQEVFYSVNSIMPWAAPNGSRWQAATNRFWIRLVHKKGHSSDQNLFKE